MNGWMDGWICNEWMEDKLGMDGWRHGYELEGFKMNGWP